MFKKTILACVFATTLSSQSNADNTTAPKDNNTTSTSDVSSLLNSWRCDLKFDLKTKSSHVFGLGAQTLDGKGVLTCRHGDPLNKSEPSEVVSVTSAEQLTVVSDRTAKDSSLNLEVKVPIKVTGQSTFAFGFGEFQLTGFSKQWSSVNRLDTLLGSYTLISVVGGLGLGSASFTAFKTDVQGLAFQVGLATVRGLGLHYGFSRIELSLKNN